MWYHNENSSSDKPNALDIETSKVYAYIRKDFELVEATEYIPAHWQWMELKILKENLPAYRQTETNAANIDYIAMMADIEIPTEGET